MRADGRLKALPGTNIGAIATVVDGKVVSEVPDYLTKLSTREKKIWRAITVELEKYDLVRRTSAAQMSVIVRAYRIWEDLSDELDRFVEGNGGSYIRESANGYRAPDPLYFMVEKQVKMLMPLLAEAGLTMQGFQKIRTAQHAERQGSLFDDDGAARARGALQIIVHSSDTDL